MFYLSHFFKILKKSPITGILFIIVSLALMISIGQKSYLEKQVSKTLVEENVGPYFYALISGEENIFRISRKMKVLPGIHSVVVLDKGQVQKRTQEILGQYKLEDFDGEFVLNHYGLKITFQPKLKTRSQTLIREYLQRLAGKEKVTLGAVHSLPVKLGFKEKAFKFARKWFWAIGVIIMTFIWLLTFIHISRHVHNSAYLIEQFQRKERVSFKIVLSGLFFLSLLSIPAIYFWGNPSWIYFSLGMLSLLLFNLINLKKSIWEN